jgi:hypothetical protein
VARTTAALVGGIVEVEPGHDLTPFIDAANLLVTDQCTGYDPAYSDSHLEIIERWLAAHCYRMGYTRMVVAQGVWGAANERFDAQELKLMLNNTPYGQQAMAFDTGGNLAALNNALQDVKKSLGGGTRISWLGSNYHPTYPEG